LSELVEEFARTHHHGFPVVNDSKDLVGVVSLQDIERALSMMAISDKTVADIATTSDLLISYPDESMGIALRRLATRGVGRLPVVENKKSKKLVGVIRRGDVIRAYNHAIVKKAQYQHRVESVRLGKLDHTSFIQVEIPLAGSVVGKTIASLGLPEECLIVSLRRDREIHVARGDTRIQGKDKLTVFSHHDCSEEIQHILSREDARNDYT
jgi:CIC family chloride channel protein